MGRDPTISLALEAVHCSEIIVPSHILTFFREPASMIPIKLVRTRTAHILKGAKGTLLASTSLWSRWVGLELACEVPQP